MSTTSFLGWQILYLACRTGNICQSLCIRIPKIISFLGVGKKHSAKIIVFGVQKCTVIVYYTCLEMITVQKTVYKL